MYVSGGFCQFLGNRSIECLGITGIDGMLVSYENSRLRLTEDFYASGWSAIFLNAPWDFKEYGLEFLYLNMN